MMPRLSGLEACRLLKGMTNESFLPVVLVTVKTDSASRVEGLKIGADDYVCKPFEEKELVARVEAMLRIKRLHDHVASARQKLETDERPRRAHRALQLPLPAHPSRRRVQTRRALPRPARVRLHRHRPSEVAQRRGHAGLGDNIIRSVAEVTRKVRARCRRGGPLRRRRVSRWCCRAPISVVR